MYTPKNDRVHFSDGEFSVTFSITAKNRIAIADLSKMDAYYLLGDLFPKIANQQQQEQLWYYFNRINKPPHFALKNAAILLYQEIAHWADQLKVNIFNDINPYGNLSADEIYTVEHLFGFKKINIFNENSYATIRLCHS